MASTIAGFINTSAEDCKIDLSYNTCLPFLRELLVECERIGHKTRARYVRSRINELEREVA